MDEWLSVLVFWPSMAIAFSGMILYSAKCAFMDGIEHGEKMYELGLRHGREKAAMDVYKLSAELFTPGIFDSENQGETPRADGTDGA